MSFVSTILCVDDDADDLLFVREAIQSQGHSFTIEEAKDGQEALKFLEQAKIDKRLPCLVIMDMNMPKMNGKQTIKKIKEDPVLATIPIAVFTTSAADADRKHFEKEGVHFMTKPFDHKIFIKEIVDLLAFCADLGH